MSPPPPVQLPAEHPDAATPLVSQPLPLPAGNVPALPGNMADTVMPNVGDDEMISPRTARRVEQELATSETVDPGTALVSRQQVQKLRKGDNPAIIPPKGGAYPRDSWKQTPVGQVLHRQVSGRDPPPESPRVPEPPGLPKSHSTTGKSIRASTHATRVADRVVTTAPHQNHNHGPLVTVPTESSYDGGANLGQRSKTQGSMKTGGGIRWADDETDGEGGVIIETGLVSRNLNRGNGESGDEGPVSPRTRTREWQPPIHTAPKPGTATLASTTPRVARTLKTTARSPRTRDMSRDISFRMETPGHGSNRVQTSKSVGSGLGAGLGDDENPGMFKADYLERYVTGMIGQLRSGVRGDIATQTEVTIDANAELAHGDDSQYQVDGPPVASVGEQAAPTAAEGEPGPDANSQSVHGPFGSAPPPNILGLSAEEKAKFDEAFVTQMMGEIEIALPPSKIPKEFWETKTAEVRQMLAEFQNVEITHDEEEKMWNATLFPSKNPSSRMEVIYLARCLEGMLTKHKQGREEDIPTRPKINRREPWKNTETLRKLNVEDTYLAEIKVWDLAWSEVIRQVHVHCTERGVLLERIRRRYGDCLEDILYGFTASQDCITDLQERLTYKEKLLEESLAREKQLPIDFEIAKEAALAGLREELRLSNEKAEKEKNDRWKTQEELWRMEKQYRRLKEIVATGDINLEDLEAQIEEDDEKDKKEEPEDDNKPLFGNTMDTMLDALNVMEKEVEEDQQAKEEALAKQNAKGFKGPAPDPSPAGASSSQSEFQLPRTSKMGARMDSQELLPDPEESQLDDNKAKIEEVKIDEVDVGKNATLLLEQSAMQLIQFGTWMANMEDLVIRLEDEDSDSDNEELAEALTMTELVEQLVEKVNVISSRLEKLTSEEEYERQRANMQQGLMHLAEKKKKRKKKKKKKGMLETAKPLTKQEYDIKITDADEVHEKKREEVTEEMTAADTEAQREIQELRATIQALQNAGQSSEIEIDRVREDRDRLKAELAEQAEFDKREIAMLEDKIENLIAIEREDEKVISDLTAQIEELEAKEQASEAELETLKKAKEDLEQHQANLDDTLSKKEEVKKQQDQIEKGNETDAKDKDRLAALERELETLKLASTASPAEIERIKVEHESKVKALEDQMSDRENQYQEMMLRLAADHQVELDRLQWEREKAPDEEDPEYQAKMADPNAEWEEEETVWHEVAVHTRQTLSKEEAHLERLRLEAESAKNREIEEKRRRRVLAKLEGREDELSDEEEEPPLPESGPPGTLERNATEPALTGAPTGQLVMPKGMLSNIGINPFTGKDMPQLSRDGMKNMLLRKFRELQGVNKIHRDRKAQEEYKRAQDEAARIEAERERFHDVGVQCGEEQIDMGVQVQLGTASSWAGAATGGMSYPRVLKNLERMAEKRREEQLLSDRLFSELSLADEAALGEPLIDLDDLKEELDDDDQELEDELNAAKFVRQDGDTTTCPHCSGFIIIPFGMSGGGADGDGGGDGGGGQPQQQLDPYAHLMQSQMQQYEMEDEEEKGKYATGPDGKKKKGARSSRYGVARDRSAVVLAGDLAEGFSCNNDRLRDVVNKMLDSKIKPKSKTWLLRIMKDVYKDKKHHDEIADRDGLPHLSLPDFLFEYLKQLYGTKSLVDQTFYSIVNTMMLFRSDDTRIEVFARFVEEDWDSDLFDIYILARRYCDESKVGVSFLEGAGRGQELKERYLDTERAFEVAQTVLGTRHPTAVERFAKLVNENSQPMDPADFKGILPNPRQKAVYAKALEDLLVQNRRKMKLDFFLFTICEAHVIFERGYEAKIHDVFQHKEHNTGDGFMERSHFELMMRNVYPITPMEIQGEMWERGLAASLNPAGGKIDYKGFSAMMLKSAVPRSAFRAEYVPPEDLSTREATGGVDSKEQMSQFLQRAWTTFSPVFQESLQIFRSYTINDVTKTLGILSRALQKSINVEADGAKGVDAYRRLLAVIGTQLFDIQASFKLIGRADSIDVKKMEDEVAALEKAFMGVFEYVSKRVTSMSEPASRQLARSGAMGRIMGKIGQKSSMKSDGGPGQAGGSLVVGRRRGPGGAAPVHSPSEAQQAVKAGAAMGKSPQGGPRKGRARQAVVRR